MATESSLLVSLLPETLLEKDKVLAKLRKAAIQKRIFLENFIENNLLEIAQLRTRCLELEKTENNVLNKLTVDIEEIVKDTLRKETEIKDLKKQTFSIKNNLKVKTCDPCNGVELGGLAAKVELLKCEVQNQEKVIDFKFQQFIRGVQFYKKYLQCRVIYVPQGQVIFTLNPSAKQISEASEYIRFESSDAVKFSYVEMHPKLKVEERLVKWFEKTKNIQGFILLFIKGVNCQKETIYQV